MDIPKNMPILAEGLRDVKPSKPAESPDPMPNMTLSQKIILKINVESGVVNHLI